MMENKQLKKLLSASAVTSLAAGALFVANAEQAFAYTEETSNSDAATETEGNIANQGDSAELTGENKPAEKQEAKKVNFSVGFSFRPIENTQGIHHNEPVEGAVIELTNKETGEVFTYTTGSDGKQSQFVPLGEYVMELVSVPDSIKNKEFDWPKAKDITVSGIAHDGLSAEEKEQNAPEVQPEEPAEKVYKFEVEFDDETPVFNKELSGADLSATNVEGKFQEVFTEEYPEYELSDANFDGEVYRYTATKKAEETPEPGKPDPEPTPEPGNPDTGKGEGDNNGTANTGADKKGKTNEVKEADPKGEAKADKKAAAENLPQTGFVPGVAVGLGTIVTALGSALTFRRRK